VALAGEARNLGFAGQQSAVEDEHAFRGHGGSATAALNLADAKRRGAEHGMGLLSPLRVQTLDLGDYRGGAIDGIRAVVRLTRVSGAPVDLDAKVGRTAGGDDQLE